MVTIDITQLHGIMSRPGKFVCEVLVLLCLCALSNATEKSNETETTTAKADAGPSGAETNRVETIHLHGQETQPNSYSYSEAGPGYLPDDTGYSNQQHEDQTYEYGKRVGGGGQYKGSPSLGYNHPQTEDQHTSYIDAFENYGQRQINGHEQPGGKGNSYKQGGQIEYGPEEYGKEAYEQGYSNEGGKQGAYVQAYSNGEGKQVSYAYEVPKTQEYVADDGYGTKQFVEQAHYDLENSKVPSPKGYDDTSSYNTGAKSYDFPPTQTIGKTDYSSGAYSGKSSSGENAYGSGSYSGGKSSTGDNFYGQGPYSGGKSSGDLTIAHAPYSGGKSSGAYVSNGYSDGKSSSGNHAYGSGSHSGGKSSGAYVSGGYSGGKSSSGDIAYGQGHYNGGKSSGDIAYGSPSYSGGKSSGDIAYVTFGHSGGKSPTGDISYGSGPHSGGKSDGAYVSTGYSGGKPSTADIAYGPGHNSGGKSAGAYVSSGYSSGKSSSGDIAYGPATHSGGKTSGGIAYVSAGYSGGKSGNGAHGSADYSSGGKSATGGIAHGFGAYSSGAYSPGQKSISEGIAYTSGAGGYSTDGGSSYPSDGKSNNFPSYPKEAGYILGGSKEPSYFHAIGNHGSDNQKEAGYYHESPSKGSDLSSISHQGKSDGGSNQGKVSVFIKQLGHSQNGDNYGSQNGERHGYLLLPVVPGKDGDKIKIATTGSYAGGEYKDAGHDGVASDYSRSPVHASGGKSSYTSFFKTGGAVFSSDSAHKGGSDYGLGKESYGTESKSGYKTGGGYRAVGNGGQNVAKTEPNAYAVSDHSSYEAHTGNPKGTPYVSEHEGQHNVYQEGGHGILSENVKYIPAHEFQQQQAYAGGDAASYGKSVQIQQHDGKGTPYVKEVSGYQLQVSHGSPPKGYDQGHIEQTSYGHISGPVAIPEDIKYVGQGPDYGHPHSYGGHEVASYGHAVSKKQLNGKGSDFQPVNKYSSPVLSPVADYPGNHNHKVQSNTGTYTPYNPSKSNKKPKSIALILQRHQPAEQQQGYPFPARTENSKSLYSSTGFQPMLPKHLGGSASLQYSVRSLQASPSYSTVEHKKGGSRYY